MGVSGSKSRPCPPNATFDGEDAPCYEDNIEPPWPLPSTSQDALWTTIQLSTLLGVGIPGTTGGGHILRAASGRGGLDGSNIVLSPRRSMTVDGEETSEEWLDASLCLSMAALQHEDMVLLVGRAKGTLLRRLSRLCDQDDVFCESVSQRIHAMYCIHAAMTRQRVREAKRAPAAAVTCQGVAVVERLNTGQIPEKLVPGVGWGDAGLGLQLFFSLLDFVRDPGCGPEQLVDFLRQISPVLSNLQPLCLVSTDRRSADEAHSRTATQSATAPSVVHTLRSFLVSCVVPKGIGIGKDEQGEQALPVLNSGERDIALSALISLVSARGRASDMLVLVKVLLEVDAGEKSANVTPEEEEDRVVPLGGDEPKKDVVLADCSAKRRPISLAKARMSRQGLPVHNDDGEDACESPLLAASAVAATGGGLDNPTAGCDAGGDPWHNKQASSGIPGTRDRAKSSEPHPTKGRKCKGEWMKPLRTSDPEPWQTNERANNNQFKLSETCPVVHATPEDDKGGIKLPHILPLLRQIRDAKRKQRSLLGRATNSSCRREVWTCGQNSYGELGHNDTGTRKTLCLVKMFEDKEIVDIAAGNEHTVVLSRAGEVFAAGYNDNGQCGQGAKQRVGVLTRIPLLVGKRAVQVHAYNGCEHTLVVLEDGTVVSFGYNYRGQLGHGNTTSESVPKPVRGLDGTRVTTVSCSYYHSVLSCENGEVYSFGRNDFGQLGSGDIIDRKLPSPVESLRGQRVTSLACGQYHTVISTVEIGAQSCGKNDFGQLGVDSTDFQLNLVPVRGALQGSTVKHVRCGYYHTIVLAAGGHVLGFGRNDYGQLGLGHIIQRVFGPKLIEGAERKGVCRVSAGCYHTVLIAADGILYVFGRNHHGQLGTGDTIERHSPFPVNTFLGKRVSKVAAGFYHTIVLTAADEEDNMEPRIGEDMNRWSPYAILSNPALTLPSNTHDETLTAHAMGPQAEIADCRSDAPEISSPVYEREASISLNPLYLRTMETSEANVGVVAADRTRAGTLRTTFPGDGRMIGRKSAVFIMAHMDRLSEAITVPKGGGFPIIGNAQTDAAADNPIWPNKGEREGRRENEVGKIDQDIYCVDLCPDTFELLSSILTSLSQKEKAEDFVDDSELPSRSYLVLAALRVLKANLARMLQSSISPQIITSMMELSTQSELDHANELRLEDWLEYEPALDTAVFTYPGAKMRAPDVGGDYDEAGSRMSETDTGTNQDNTHNDCRQATQSDDPKCVKRYQDVLRTLRRQLLLLVYSDSSYTLCLGAGERVQREAAAVLVLGLELFFSSQAQQFRLLSKLINTAEGVDQDEAESDKIDSDSVDQTTLCGPIAARRYILDPLLRRMCDDALAVKLIPYGSDEDDKCSVCTAVERSEATLGTRRLVAASVRVLDMQVKLLVDQIAQGTPRGTCSGEAFDERLRSQECVHRQQEGGSSCSVSQLNGSATDQAESFDLENTHSAAVPARANDSGNNPLRTRRLFIELVLALMKHILHWAAGNYITVDPTRWQSRVLGYGGGGNGQRVTGSDLDKSRATTTPGWFAVRAKELCDRAAAVILDGVDRTPSSWRCLIKYARQVLKGSIATLETTLAKEPISGGGAAGRVGCALEAADEMKRIDRLEHTLVGALLPAVINGLLPFAHLPVFARQLMQVVASTVRLLDAACCRCPALRQADARYVAARNGGVSRTKTKAACFTRGENGKLGAGGGECDRRGEEKSPGAEPGTTGSKVLNNWVDHGSLPWLLSLAKTTTLLAGRYAATLTVGNCGISPFLESYFRSPTYRQWLKSDLLSGGCDPSYEALMLTPIDANSGEDASSCLENNIRAAVPETNACSTSHFQWVRNAMPSRREVADFLEEVAGGYGRGGRFSVWLGETLAPSDAAYRIIKRQATTGRNGGLLRNAERVMLAAMLKHADLDRDAVLFSSALVKRRESGGDETPNGTTIRPPPRKFALLWKSMAEMTGWLWHSRSKLRSADVDPSMMDRLLEEASDCGTILLLLQPVGRVPAALGAKSTGQGRRTILPEAHRRWQSAVSVVRATIRWRKFATELHRPDVIVAVPRFIRGMLEVRVCPGKPSNVYGEDSEDQRERASLGCLLVLFVLVLHNHQRAVTRASGIRAFHSLAVAVRTPSFLADLLLPLPAALRTPHLVDGHHLTHLSSVGGGILYRVTAAFHALHSKLLRVLEDCCRCVDGGGAAIRASSEDLAEQQGQEGVQSNQCRTLDPRFFDSRTILVLLEVWGITIQPEDWAFLEKIGVMSTIALVATYFAADGVCVNSTGAIVENFGIDDTPEGELDSRKGRRLRPQDSVASVEAKRAFATCHAAAWTLFRALIIQLHGIDSSNVSNRCLAGEMNPLPSVMDALYTKLGTCVLHAKPKTNFTRGRVRSGRNRRPQHGERTPSQAILEFAPPGVVRFPESPSPERTLTGNRAPGAGVSHKRRCQELVSSPRRLMNMEDGLAFPAEEVLNNSRGSDFSITFWLLLGQDRTGYHRTVLARGQGSERWPVVLLRDTDNRLQVCFGIPSMANLCERLTSKEPVVLNTWTHVGLISEQNKIRLYFNGTLDSQRTSTGTLRANRHPLYVGKVPNGAVRLDGARGGLEGSIAHLRFFSRALSPIHVRILCDPGPPETAKVQDQYFYHICACLVVICRSEQCQRHMRQPRWLNLLVQALTHGTIRVQQAICRIFREIIPNVLPQKMASVTLTDSGWPVVQPPTPGNAGVETDQVSLTAFTTYLLRLIGASSWYIAAVDERNDAMQVKDDGEHCCNLTVAQVLHKEQMKALLPSTIARGCERCTPTVGGIGVSGPNAGVGLQATSHYSPPVLTPETAHDLCTIGAELVALLQTLAASDLWRVAVASALRCELSHLAHFVDGTGNFLSPDPLGEGNIVNERATADDHLKLAGGDAALQVLGGNAEFFRAGVCTKVCETDEECIVLSVDQATSTVYVVLHPKSEGTVGQWIQRYNADELELQCTDVLVKGVMATFSGVLVAPLAKGASISGQEYISRMATAFLHSSPLPRPSLDTPSGQPFTAQTMRREIWLAQCRSRLARVVVRASQNISWAGKVAEDTKLLSALQRVSALPVRRMRSAVGKEDLIRNETVAMQSRLHQMLSASGGCEIVLSQIADMALNPQRGLFTEGSRAHESTGKGTREQTDADHLHSTAPFGRVWVDNLDCPFCQEETSSVSSIVEHVLNKHSADVRRVPCPVCIAEKGDVTAHNLPTHLELVHFDAVLQYKQAILPPFGESVPTEGRARRGESPPVDLLEQLMVIGFPEDWCTMALRENDNDVVNASAWIVDNLDMLSSLNSLEASTDRIDETSPTPSRFRNPNASNAPPNTESAFCREEVDRREDSVLGGNNRSARTHEQGGEYDDGARRGENCREEEERGEEGEEEGEEGEEDEDEEEGEEEEDDFDDNDDAEGDDDEMEEDNQHKDEVFDSEEEEDEATSEAEHSNRRYGRHDVMRQRQVFVVPPPRSAIDAEDLHGDKQHEMEEKTGFEEGHIVSNLAARFFPTQHAAGHDDNSCRSLPVSAIKSEIAGMELGRLTEIWFLAELSLTSLYCRAALLNILLLWPQHIPLSTASLGSPAAVVKLVSSMVFNGENLPALFTEIPLDSRALPPVPSGAYSPNVVGVFTSLLVRLLGSERAQSSPDTAVASERGQAANMEDAGEVHTPESVVSGHKSSEWGDTLAARLVAGCLNELDAAVATDSFSVLPWTGGSPTEMQRLGDGKPNLALLQWLFDLLLSADCDDIFTESVFSRLSNCLDSPNPAAKDVAMYVLASIATKWCESLVVDDWDSHQSLSEHSSTAVGLPSPLAMEETLQRHMAVSRVRSALVKRIAVECRPSGLFFTRYTQTLASLYVAVCKLRRLLMCRRQRRSSVELGGKCFADFAELSTPNVLYRTDSSVALTWIPVRRAAATPGILYEVQMAARQLGKSLTSDVFRGVYLGKRLRCRIDNLMPGQIYRFRVRAVLTNTLTIAWSGVATTETDHGVAFRFDPFNSGPAILVSGNELSASFGSNETWSTILGTTPFITGSNYWELRLDKSATAYLFIGVATRDADLTTFLGGDGNGWGFIGDRALYHQRTKVKAYGERFGQGDTIGVTLNMDHGTLSFSKNGQDLGVAFDGLAGGLYPAVAFYNQGQRLSLVPSAFRCPGAGVAILDSPLNTTPEAVLEICDVMEAMATGKVLPNTWISGAYARHLDWLAGKTARHMTMLGFELQFDVSDAACIHFGLKARARVRTPRGNAKVVGVCDGVLWFHVDGECGAWFFTEGEIWEGRVTGLFTTPSSDVLGADASEVWTRWRMANDGGYRSSENRVVSDAAHMTRMVPDVVGNAMLEPLFIEAGDCERWTPAVDGYIVAALCDHSDRQQESIWNLNPAEVLEALTPVRPRLELSLGAGKKCAAQKKESVSDDELLCRVSVLKHLNDQIVGVLPFADLAAGVQVSGEIESRSFCWGGSSKQRGLGVGAGHTPTRGLGPLLVRLRRSVFLTTKRRMLSQVVRMTTTHAKKAEDEYDYPEDLPQVTVNRLKAAAGQESTDAEARLRASVFHQLYHELRSVDTSFLRMGYTHPMDDGQQRTFKVKFEGEGVDDYGGPYREIFTQIAAEITATLPSAERTDRVAHNSGPRSPEILCLLPILEPTPSSNAEGGRGVGLEFTVLADVNLRRRLNSYKFLGQVMGIALRCRVAAPWRLSPIVWKGLVGEALQEADVEHIDIAAHYFVQNVRDRVRDLQCTSQDDAETDHDSEASEEKVCDWEEGLTWAVPARGTMVELRSGGRQLKVEPEDWPIYVRDAVHARIHEGDRALLAVRDGLASVVPTAILPLFTWEEVELQACGRPGVDIDLLQANTEYDDDTSASDPHIRSFWRVLRGFDDRDRAQFLRFVWARSRLPTRAVDFHQKFKIHSPIGDGAREDPDQYLPKAHTCFFSINLPKYSSDEVMAEKLSYTMYNCIEMDADFRLADNEMAGWVGENSTSGRGQSGEGA